jgi:hypothetical protein
MVTLHDIEKSICERLQSASYTVTAADVDEGFEKPSFFIDIFQNSVTVENAYMELVNVGVELKYYAGKSTREALVKLSDSLTELFTKTALKVHDRFLSVYEITFDTDNTITGKSGIAADEVLTAYFELEFTRETAASVAVREFEKMRDLGINLKIKGGASGGTAIDID